MPWIGRKKLALVPLFRPNIVPPDQVPADWENQILQRVLFDPQPVGGADRSLRAYIHAASSGKADLDAVVMPRETANQREVPVNFLEAKLGAQLRAKGFDAAAIVMLGGPGAGSAQRGGFWARFVMAEALGVWAMEFMHCLTGFADIRSQPGFVDSRNGEGEIDGFDEMATAMGTHPSAYTKSAIGWLAGTAIALHSRREASYDLHAIGLVQPPPSGRVAAVRIGSQVPFFIVEARQKVDQFDRNIPSEGVIIYRVQTSDPLGNAQNNKIPVFLLTSPALKPGKTLTLSTGVKVKVTSASVGGFTVQITSPADARCPGIREQIAEIDEDLRKPGLDPQTRKELLQERGELKAQAKKLGCS